MDIQVVRQTGYRSSPACAAGRYGGRDGAETRLRRPPTYDNEAQNVFRSSTCPADCNDCSDFGKEEPKFVLV